MPKKIINEENRRIPLNITIQRNVLKEFDKKRDLIKRSTLIEKLIKDYLAEP